MNDELPALTKLCRELGAPPGQAETMARQLSKRADQLAAERGQPREAAMAYLLRLVAEGRQGAVPEEFRPAGKAPTDQNNSGNPAK